MQAKSETTSSLQENNKATKVFTPELEKNELIEEENEEKDEIHNNEPVKRPVRKECEVETPQKSHRSTTSTSSGKVVTLQTLLDDGLLQAGKGVLAIEYLGQKFTGDLLEDGKIQSQETDLIFASPSAWAFACKRIINPIKKSGCGWSSVRYNGRKLDVYKNIYLKKKRDMEDRLKEAEEAEQESRTELAQANSYQHQMMVKHNTIANRTFTHDANTMIECVPFSNIGKIQPFLISLSTNSALLMDFHCHLTDSEVVGYLAGSWDFNSHNLYITRAFPCRNTNRDRDKSAEVESKIQKAMRAEKLKPVGWYHSHPHRAAAPTLRDVDAQLEHQIRMKGTTENNYTPCIGLIISPYNADNQSLESIITAYWVIPPPENKPNEYGRPMAMSFSVAHDSTLHNNVKEEMKACVQYYESDPSLIKFSENYGNTSTSYLDKLKTSLLSKFPRDESEISLWGFVRHLLGFKPLEEEPVLSIPSVTKSSLMPPVTMSMNPNMMLTSDIANALFSSGKFPNATSLLGLPDPMAHSTLAANNMFLSTNLFKMQELLRPLSTSSPSTSTSSSSSKSMPEPTISPLKIPNETKVTFATPSTAVSASTSSSLDYMKIPKTSPAASTSSSGLDFKYPKINNSSFADFPKMPSVAGPSGMNFKPSKYDNSNGAGSIDFSKLPKFNSSAIANSLDFTKIPKFDYTSDLNLLAALKSKFDYSGLPMVPAPTPLPSTSSIPHPNHIMTPPLTSPSIQKHIIHKRAKVQTESSNVGINIPATVNLNVKSFSAADLSISSVKKHPAPVDYTLDLSKKVDEKNGEKPAKIAKLDMECIGLDMSTSKSENFAAKEDDAINLSNETNKKLKIENEESAASIAEDSKEPKNLTSIAT